MTEILKIKKKNESFLHIQTDLSVQMELQDHFQFEIEGAKFSPKYKAGIWDGKIRLFDLRQKTIYAGIYDQVVEFAKARNYEIELEASQMYGLPGEQQNVSMEEIKEFCDALNTHSRGEKLIPRDYQYDAVYTALLNKRLSIISPTGSGKSWIIYSLVRYILEQDMRVLILVPTIGLVNQMKSDFIDYSSENDFDVESIVHQISAGKEKNTKKPIVISTWQSLQGDKVSNGWLNSFDCVICDELQTAKGQEIQKLMERCTDVSYRIGLTGTLDNIKLNRLVISGLFGNIHRVSTTRKLMDEGHLSDLKIKCLILDYSKETKKLFRGKIDYSLEMKFISEHDRRNRFIRNLALSLNGNTLILFNLINHGKTIFKSITDKAGERDVHMIYGGVDADDREEIRQLMINSKNVIAVASYGTTAAGVNIPNVENIIFASPYKSMIRVLQSIGRGLRNADGKDHCKLFDIADRLSGSKSKPNHTYNHLVERLRIYSTEGFNYTLTEVNIEE